MNNYEKLFCFFLKHIQSEVENLSDQDKNAKSPILLEMFYSIVLLGLISKNF